MQQMPWGKQMLSRLLSLDFEVGLEDWIVEGMGGREGR